VCLIDYSGTISEATLQAYASILSEDVLLNLNKFDKLSILPIDEGAKTNPVYLTYIDLVNKNFEKTSDGLANKEKLENQRVTNYLNQKSDSIKSNLIDQKNIRKEFTQYTDILSALEQVSTNIESTNKKSSATKIWNAIVGKKSFKVENVLIICSDMIHESQRFNLKNLPKEEIEELIDKLESSGLIADLSGVKVFVNGRTGANNNIVEKVEKFWRLYFKKANANLKNYAFDSHHSIIELLNTN
jgi:hypothetical protein